MTIREELQQFLSEKPFSNPLTPEEMDALDGWINGDVVSEYYRQGYEAAKRDTLAAKLRRLAEAGYFLRVENRWCWLAGPGKYDGRYIISLRDIEPAVNAVIAELEKRAP